jgi:hypothetical protein
MVEGIKTILMEDAREFVGKDVVLTVIEGGAAHNEIAHVDTVAHVSHSGPCFITDHGDFRLDHVAEIRAA